MGEEMKKTRARSPEKKEEQFNRILEVGMEMFVKYGTHGFSTRALAKQLNMTQPNLYNYVRSKRELWIAIRTKYYKEFSEHINLIVKEHRGPFTELFLKFAQFFMEFMAEDYKRFQIMFLISAPPSKKVGELEQKYQPFQLVQKILKLFKGSLKGNELDGSKANKIFYYIYGAVLGAAKVSADLKLRNKITEPIVEEFDDLSAKEYRVFVLEEIKDRISKISFKDHVKTDNIF